MAYITELYEVEEVDLARIMTEYGDSVFRMCYIYLKDRTLAEDAVQDTFIKVYQKYGTFRSQADEKTWVMSIAINVCKNHRRTSWFKRVVTGVSLEDIQEGEIERLLVKKEEEQNLLMEISKLDTKYKEVILLYYYQELSTRQVAEILGIKEGTVRVRLQRAREKLSIKLQEVDIDEKGI